MDNLEKLLKKSVFWGRLLLFAVGVNYAICIFGVFMGEYILTSIVGLVATLCLIIYFWGRRVRKSCE